MSENSEVLIERSRDEEHGPVEAHGGAIVGSGEAGVESPLNTPPPPPPPHLVNFFEEWEKWWNSAVKDRDSLKFITPVWCLTELSDGDLAVCCGNGRVVLIGRGQKPTRSTVAATTADSPVSFVPIHRFDASCCVELSYPIVATSASDKSIKIWNIKTRTVITSNTETS